MLRPERYGLSGPEEGHRQPQCALQAEKEGLWNRSQRGREAKSGPVLGHNRDFVYFVLFHFSSRGEGVNQETIGHLKASGS